MIKDKYHEPLSEFQKRECSACRFSDKKLVGTGKACCTYPGVYEIDDLPAAIHKAKVAEFRQGDTHIVSKLIKQFIANNHECISRS